MQRHSESWSEGLARDGFCRLPGVLSPREVAAASAALATALAAAVRPGLAIRRADGEVQAARDVLAWFPAAARLWQQPDVLCLLEQVLGPDYGLVRVLYFDKPPQRNWSLPWHKDKTIAVAAHATATGFRKPTVKAGVPHLEAPLDLLQCMLTVRLHLDEVTADNGPLQVIAGSHRSESMSPSPAGEIVSILAQPGDALALRPLLTHGSPLARTESHRRVLHFEFCGRRQLPGELQWHTFLPAAQDARASCADS